MANPLMLDDVFHYSHEHFTNSALLDTRGNKIKVGRMRYFGSAEDLSSYTQDIIRREILDAAADPTPRILSKRLETRCKRKANHFFHLAKIYEPYVFYKAWFDNSNTENLMEEMSIEEERRFGFNLRKIEWEDYFLNVHIPGLRRHVLRK
uniref:Fatty acyl-CoA reductase C-terminal domain-containing protein n=1 Tax=Kalanchoe fedtschenkoi TaxID=63787 RepID=A0A7N1A740_KALFE